jgi:hypothetical protein
MIIDLTLIISRSHGIAHRPQIRKSPFFTTDGAKSPLQSLFSVNSE